MNQRMREEERELDLYFMFLLVKKVWMFVRRFVQLGDRMMQHQDEMADYGTDVQIKFTERAGGSFAE